MSPLGVTPVVNGKKTLSDSEVLAYSKNRFADRTLRYKVQELQDQKQVCHDKHRRQIFQVRESMRQSTRTSGSFLQTSAEDEGICWPHLQASLESSSVEEFKDSIASDPLLQQNSQRKNATFELVRSSTFSNDILNKLQKPWAYTFSLTSYNALYNESEQQGRVQEKRLFLKRASSKISANPSFIQPHETKFVKNQMSADNGKRAISFRPRTGQGTFGKTLLKSASIVTQSSTISETITRPKTSIGVVRVHTEQKEMDIVDKYDRGSIDIPTGVNYNDMSKTVTTPIRVHESFCEEASEELRYCPISAQSEEHDPILLAERASAHARNLSSLEGSEPERQKAGQPCLGESDFHTRSPIQTSSISLDHKHNTCSLGDVCIKLTQVQTTSKALQNDTKEQKVKRPRVSMRFRGGKQTLEKLSSHLLTLPATTAGKIRFERESFDRNQKISSSSLSAKSLVSASSPSSILIQKDDEVAIRSKSEDVQTAILAESQDDVMAIHSKSECYNNRSSSGYSSAAIYWSSGRTLDMVLQNGSKSLFSPRHYPATDHFLNGKVCRKGVSGSMKTLTREINSNHADGNDVNLSDRREVPMLSSSAKRGGHSENSLSAQKSEELPEAALCTKTQQSIQAIGLTERPGANLDKMEKTAGKSASEPFSLPRQSPNSFSEDIYDSADFCLSERGGSEHSDYTVFKGFKLRNYVPPQERYRTDPFLCNRRQRSAIHLSVQQPVRLRGSREDTNPERILPKTARKRILQELIVRNNQPIKPQDSGVVPPKLKAKIDNFFKTIEPYISKTRNNS